MSEDSTGSGTQVLGAGVSAIDPGHGRGYALGYLQDIKPGAAIVEYLERIEATFEPYGGAWLVHGSDPVVLEGHLPGTVVLIGFPSLTKAQHWYESSAYQDILALRTENSTSVAALLPGVRPGYTASETIAKLVG